MKTLITSLMILGLINLTHAQDELTDASITTSGNNPKYKESKNVVLKNHEFISKLNDFELPVVIKKMRSKVAEFNINDLKLFTPGEQASYKVVFDEGDHMVEAYYDYEGQLTLSKELYKNIKVPYSISSQLAKDYPGWAFSTTSCRIVYTKLESPEITYKVTLNKGNQKKTVKVLL